MRFYVASKFDNHDQVRKVCERLSSMGHTITYDWTTTGLFLKRDDDWINVGGKGMEIHPTLRHYYALEDMTGAKSCDVLVLLVDDDMCGALMEVGMALAMGKQVFVVGKVKRWTIFYALPQVEILENVDAFFHYIRYWTC